MIRTAILLMLFILLSAVVRVFATPQIPDVLIHEGKEYPIYTNWLDAYFKKFPDRLPESDWVCTALSQGYRSTFATENRKIYLKDLAIDVCDDGKGKSVLGKVVPNGERLYIGWANTLLQSAYGENRGDDPYSISEYMDTYEKYSFFEIENGKINEVRHFSNGEFKEFRKRQAAAYFKTDEYRRVSREMLEKNPTMSKNELDKRIPNSVFFYTRKFLVK